MCSSEAGDSRKMLARGSRQITQSHAWTILKKIAAFAIDDCADAINEDGVLQQLEGRQ
jgi:hypothetical protein